jgi:hypothetical protein
MVFLFGPLFYHCLQAHPSPNLCQSHKSAERGRYVSKIQQATSAFTSAAFLIGAHIKVKLKASKYDSTSQILFFSPNEERSTSAAFLKDDNKRVVGSGGDPWEAAPRSMDWLVD